jgi:hypothetical protein
VCAFDQRRDAVHDHTERKPNLHWLLGMKQQKRFPEADLIMALGCDSASLSRPPLLSPFLTCRRRIGISAGAPLLAC